MPQSTEESPTTKNAGTRGGVSGNDGVGGIEVDEEGELVELMKSTRFGVKPKKP